MVVNYIACILKEDISFIQKLRFSRKPGVSKKPVINICMADVYKTISSLNISNQK